MKTKQLIFASIVYIIFGGIGCDVVDPVADPTFPVDPTQPSITSITPTSDSTSVTKATQEAALGQETVEPQVAVSPEIEAIVVPIPTATQLPVSIPPFQPLNGDNLPTTCLLYTSDAADD